MVFQECVPRKYDILNLKIILKRKKIRKKMEIFGSAEHEKEKREDL